ncbi:nucleotidyltransferase family protein [Aeromonas veronii]|uniref:nucleotidyltransferase family protein n=1 Tax=Aeromonas veronii TaxID=654 RepID=UPI0024444DA3|nr:nucleotidyltransferase family protein [Aeromonas veronii]EKP0313040.1 nucleotidyltransferase family protein [Aeromonas veronii]
MSNNWKNVLLEPIDSIRSALDVINEEALRVALIVDKEDRLVGVVTDGDIRRAILAQMDLNSPISQVMNRTPVTANQMQSRSDILVLMKQHSILSVPIVDAQNRLLGLETWEKTSAHRRYDNPVFIMAGGFGTRLKPLTDTCPKPMLKIGYKPMLEILIERFAKAGFHNIYISTHYLPEMITEYFGNGERWGVNIQYVYEVSPLGTGGALGLLPEDVTDLPLIMINGDVLTTLDFERLLQYHTTSDAVATMCVRQYEYQIPYGVVTSDGEVITEMVEKPIQSYFVNAGIYMLQPHLFKSVTRGQVIDMPTLLEQHIEQGETVRMLPIHEYWLDIGRMDDFQRAQSDIRQLEL